MFPVRVFWTRKTTDSWFCQRVAFFETFTLPPMLAAVCKRMQQLPTILGPVVRRGKDTTHKTLETMWAPAMLEELSKQIQHYCATLRRSRNKRNVGSCWLKRLIGFKPCETTPNNTQQHAMANNVAFVCKGLYSSNNWRDWKQIWPQLFKR